MLFLLVAWFVLGSIWLIIGNGLLSRLGVSQDSTPSLQSLQSLGVAILLGMGLTGLLWYAIALFLPLSPLVASLTLSLLLILSYSASRSKTQLWQLPHLSIKTLGFLLLIAIIVAWFLSQPITAYDTGLYHHQVIKWLNQYGAVPGLALLHYTYGYPSAWLALSAPLEGILPGRAATVISGLTFLLALYAVIPSLQTISQQKGAIADWFFVLASLLCLTILCWFGLPVSPSPDVGVICLALFIAHQLLQRIPQPAQPQDLIPLGLSIIALSCKTTALPFLFVVLVWFISRHWQQPKYTLGVVGGSTLAISPLLLFGIVTSGCPLYPTSLLCWHHFPWSLGAETIERVAQEIQNCARWICPPTPPQSYSLLDWLIPWMAQQKQAVFLLLCNVLIATGALLTAWQHKARPDIQVPCFATRHYWTLWCLAASGSLLILTGSPSIRFGITYLFILPSLWAAELCWRRSRWCCLVLWAWGLTTNLWLNPSFSFWSLLVLLVLLTIAARFVGFNSQSQRSQAWALRWWLTVLFLVNTALTFKTSLVSFDYQTAIIAPPQMQVLDPAISTWQTTNNLTYLTIQPDYQWQRPSGVITDEDRCWDAPLPCSPNLTVSNIQLREPSQGLKAGFVVSH